MMFTDDDAWIAQADAADPLRHLRSAFVLPCDDNGAPLAYFAGHSLGPQPRATAQRIADMLADWAHFGVDGHFIGRRPWMFGHELVRDATARLVGAAPHEVVVMNSLTVNLHLMMASFYRPTAERHRILIEAGPFSSDRYAIAAQALWHGHAPADTIVEVHPRDGEACLRDDDILAAIDRHGRTTALVLFGNCQYLTGQAFDMRAIAAAGHRAGCVVGFDLAHGVGNLDCQIAASGADFAVWCNYKYVNGGPGCLGGAFVHERHHRADLPRLAGWWGHDPASRFAMGPQFAATPSADGWQLSNPPILPIAALHAALESFDQVGIAALRARGDRLTAWLQWWIDRLPPGEVDQLTPREPSRRGSMLTLRFKRDAAAKVDQLRAHGVVADFRRPDVIRLTPAPLYTSWADVARVGRALRAICNAG